MDALELLAKQHREAESLFAAIEQAGDDEEKQMLFQELADALAAHATIEEQIFYPAVYGKETRELLTLAVEEHLSIKRLIADLMQLLPEHENFAAKLSLLKEQVAGHVHEEECTVFKAAESELRPEQLGVLGEGMARLYRREIAAEPSAALPEQTDAAAPLP